MNVFAIRSFAGEDLERYPVENQGRNCHQALLVLLPWVQYCEYTVHVGCYVSARTRLRSLPSFWNTQCGGVVLRQGKFSEMLGLRSGVCGGKRQEMIRWWNKRKKWWILQLVTIVYRILINNDLWVAKPNLSPAIYRVNVIDLVLFKIKTSFSQMTLQIINWLFQLLTWCR